MAVKKGIWIQAIETNSPMYSYLVFSLHLPDVPANISEARLKDRLEEEFEEGILAVERSGTCAGFLWKVTWQTRGGDHPTMQVSGDGLSGNDASVTVQTIVNGGLFLDPIPGEFLRMPKSSGQVGHAACRHATPLPKNVALRDDQGFLSIDED